MVRLGLGGRGIFVVFDCVVWWLVFWKWFVLVYVVGFVFGFWFVVYWVGFVVWFWFWLMFCVWLFLICWVYGCVRLVLDFDWLVWWCGEWLVSCWRYCVLLLNWCVLCWVLVGFGWGFFVYFDGFFEFDWWYCVFVWLVVCWWNFLVCNGVWCVVDFV